MQITVQYNDEEADDFNRAHQAQRAWEALSEIHGLVRNQLKHGTAGNDHATLENVKSIAAEVLWLIGE